MKNKLLCWSMLSVLSGILMLSGCGGESAKVPEGQDSTSAMMQGATGGNATGGAQTLGTGGAPSGAPGSGGPR